MAIKVGINGFGRIGRMVFRAAVENFSQDIEIVGINDLLDPDYLAYMLKYDSVHGIFKHDIKVDGNNMIVDGKKIRLTAEKDPTQLKWNEVGAEIVVESTGLFLEDAKARQHIQAGAKKVIMSAPSKDSTPMFVYGVNHMTYAGQDIISNASCTTNCLAPISKVLNDKFGIKRIVYSTYQAVSGAGVAGYNDLKDGINGVAPKKFPRPIAYNMLPHIDVFMEDGYTKEEWKMIVETRKILHDQSLRVTATTVRVPVFYGHSESINVEFCKKCEKQDVVNALENFPGIIVMDDVKNNVYPTPLDAENHDEVFVGRIRMDESVDSGANLWVVADNIRKGAATNAVQIVELLIKNALEA